MIRMENFILTTQQQQQEKNAKSWGINKISVIFNSPWKMLLSWNLWIFNEKYEAGQ